MLPKYSKTNISIKIYRQFSYAVCTNTYLYLGWLTTNYEEKTLTPQKSVILGNIKFVTKQRK